MYAQSKPQPSNPPRLHRLERAFDRFSTHRTQSQKNTVPIPPPHSRSRYTRHNRYTWNALLLVRPENAPVPPPKREVLETGPGHSRTQPPAHTAGRHCGVLRREVRPTVGVEGADVVGAIHVSGWMYVSIGVISSFGVCVCVRERGRARAIEREGEREREIRTRARRRTRRQRRKATKRARVPCREGRGASSACSGSGCP